MYMEGWEKGHENIPGDKRGGAVSELRGLGVDWLICRDTKDVENGGRKSGGERKRETTKQVLKSSIDD